MSNILVSLVIPAYNVENLISMTLDSVINQTLENFECIVVDDFSNDQTKRIVLDYIKHDKRIKLIGHRANAGLSAARNTGLRAARGKYVAFLDSDDLIMRESLAMRASTLENSEDSKVVGTYSGSVTISMDCKKPPEAKAVKLKLIDFITAAGNCPFNANQPMFKTDVFRKLGGFDHSLKQAEDYDMWVRVLRTGLKFIPTNMQLVTYRQTEGSMIRENPLLHLDTSYKRFMDCYQDYPEAKYNRKFPVGLRYGLGTYIAELNITNRVLEFIGISLAKGERVDVLIDRLVTYLPNYFDALEGHRDFYSCVKRGIDRYYKSEVKFSDECYKNLKLDLDNLYDEFRKASKEIVGDLNAVSLPTVKDSIVSTPVLQRDFHVVFLPHKDYHVHAINLMKPFLEKAGLNIIIVDISMHYRDEGVVRACNKYGLSSVGYSNFVLGDFEPKAIVVFNDWDPIVRSIIKASNLAGIPTIGIVEGIQDYLDADTKQSRKAYRTVKHLFLPGEHDKKYFLDTAQEILVGGVPRIFEMRKENLTKTGRIVRSVLINSNFSYGVLEECRDSWLISAVEAVKKSGLVPVISRHPADKGSLYEEYVTLNSFYEELKNCDVLISRFASGILEALAYGVLPIYYNPHGEKVDKFSQPLNSYPIAFSDEELFNVLSEVDGKYDEFSPYFDGFLNSHTGEKDENPSDLISRGINEVVSKYDLSMCNYGDFYDYLKIVDLNTGSFNNISLLRKEGYEEWFRGDDFSISKTFSLIRRRKYSAASDVATQLLKTDPDNPAYLNLKSMTKKLLLSST